ncbi:MAG: hypothetical protein PHR92_08415 [Lachnospiraceae bacterium]|nr:hypothetical protein [Lachnospiraceae bacterium]
MKRNLKKNTEGNENRGTDRQNGKRKVRSIKNGLALAAVLGLTTGNLNAWAYTVATQGEDGIIHYVQSDCSAIQSGTQEAAVVEDAAPQYTEAEVKAAESVAPEAEAEVKAAESVAPEAAAEENRIAERKITTAEESQKAAALEQCYGVRNIDEVSEQCYEAVDSIVIDQSLAVGSSDDSSEWIERPSEAADFAAYEAYGLTYQVSTDKLYYKGELVRYFEDLYPLSENRDEMAGITYFDKTGTVDVHANRDFADIQLEADGSYDPSGKLQGVSAYSQAEFNARDLSQLSAPETAVAQSGEPLTQEELMEEYAPFEKYGLTYDVQTDRLYYKGELVRKFVDVMESNGEELGSGKFHGMMSSHYTEGGTVDVRTLRDGSQKDKNGCSLLTGVEALSQAEFDEATENAYSGVYVY